MIYRIDGWTLSDIPCTLHETEFYKTQIETKTKQGTSANEPHSQKTSELLEILDSNSFIVACNKMSSVTRTNPQLWARIKNQVMSQNVGGTSSGQWSARKAQIAVKRYKDAGGRYKGPKNPNNSLHRWSQQRWRTASGRPSHETGERYLPDRAFRHLSSSELHRINASKRYAMKHGQQYSRMPRSISKKVKPYRR